MRTVSRFLVVGLAFVTVLAVSAPPSASQAPQTLRVVFIAYQNPDQLMEDVRPVVAYLEEALGMKVRAFVATDYAGVVEALRNQSADMGFMGPLQYVIAHQQTGAVPILGEVYNGKPSYVARIFVRKDSGISGLEDLRGKTIAFVDPISSSGYLYPLETFRQAGLVVQGSRGEDFFRRIYFAGGDEQAIRAVYNRFVDAAGIGQYSYNLLRPEERDQVVAVAESAPLPSHCVVVRRGLDPQTVARLQDALLALNDGSRRSLLESLYNVDGYVKVTHADFVQVERVARAYGFLPDKQR
ncbi:MAG: phosphate/phosphite/phosphonate ABC transporter substrate-binding protein [Terriglobia bacterium]